MTNPNNNKNFNDEALRINRTLKKENDALSEIVDEFEDFLLNYDIYTTSLKTEENTIDRLYSLHPSFRLFLQFVCISPER